MESDSVASVNGLESRGGAGSVKLMRIRLLRYKCMSRSSSQELARKTAVLVEVFGAFCLTAVSENNAKTLLVRVPEKKNKAAEGRGTNAAITTNAPATGRGSSLTEKHAQAA